MTTGCVPSNGGAHEALGSSERPESPQSQGNLPSAFVRAANTCEKEHTEEQYDRLSTRRLTFDVFQGTVFVLTIIRPSPVPQVPAETKK
jgi:hypothetical protein